MRKLLFLSLLGFVNAAYGNVRLSGSYGLGSGTVKAAGDSNSLGASLLKINGSFQPIAKANFLIGLGLTNIQYDDGSTLDDTSLLGYSVTAGGFYRLKNTPVELEATASYNFTGGGSTSPKQYDENGRLEYIGDRDYDLNSGYSLTLSAGYLIVPSFKTSFQVEFGFADAALANGNTLDFDYQTYSLAGTYILRI